MSATAQITETYEHVVHGMTVDYEAIRDAVAESGHDVT